MPVQKQILREPARQALLLLGASWGASLLLRIPYYQHALTFVDEGINASTAAEILRGSVLYRDVWCNQQPLIIYFCKWMFQIFGSNSAAIHFGSLFLVCVESWLLYRIGARYFSPRVGGLAALAFAIISTNFYTPRIIGLTGEQPMIVFTTAAAYMSLRAWEKNRLAVFSLAGALVSAALFTKPAAAPELLVTPLFLLFCTKFSATRRAKAIAAFGLGCLAAAALFILEIKASGTLSLWWDQTIISRIDYVNQIGWAAFVRQAARQPLTFGLVYLWIWILIWSSRHAAAANQSASRFLWIWLAAGILGVGVGRRFYANYYIQVFPALSLLAAVALDRLLRFEPQKRRVPLAIGGIALLIPFLWFQSRTFAHWYFFFDPGAHRKVTLWDMCVIDRNQAEIAGQIRAATHPDDRIFVWGPTAEFYFLSGRRMATPFPFFDVMDRSQPPYGTQEEQTFETLLRSPPPLIVDSFKSIKMADNKRWGALLFRHYRLWRDTHGVRLYLRNDIPYHSG